MDLTDAQWAVLAPSFRPARRPDGRGRPWTDSRAVLNGVLWVLRNLMGAQSIDPDGRKSFPRGGRVMGGVTC